MADPPIKVHSLKVVRNCGQVVKKSETVNLKSLKSLLSIHPSMLCMLMVHRAKAGNRLWTDHQSNTGHTPYSYTTLTSRGNLESIIDLSMCF